MRKIVDIINTFSLKEKKKLATTMRQLTAQAVAADRRKKKRRKRKLHCTVGLESYCKHNRCSKTRGSSCLILCACWMFACELPRWRGRNLANFSSGNWNGKGKVSHIYFQFMLTTVLSDRIEKVFISNLFSFSSIVASVFLFCNCFSERGGDNPIQNSVTFVIVYGISELI